MIQVSTPGTQIGIELLGAISIQGQRQEPGTRLQVGRDLAAELIARGKARLAPVADAAPAAAPPPDDAPPPEGAPPVSQTPPAAPAARRK